MNYIQLTYSTNSRNGQKLFLKRVVNIDRIVYIDSIEGRYENGDPDKSQIIFNNGTNVYVTETVDEIIKKIEEVKASNNTLIK